MFLQSFQGIGGTGGVVATVMSNPWAEDQAIGANGQCADVGEWAHKVGVPFDGDLVQG